ncbi:hypothetical protein KIH74_18935 [Kineosporia sp. J2-2]|uniref:Uncharacterized protein n=1 Tax=Kineosporia corallincola TaxID=2835133 RepID=A0ABS5TIU2_9ACTN|nr:hypothetical protein [Kineosporia corallincola]MBT0771022.1 hypothetical protein [Kineosporia corallincola]
MLIDCDSCAVRGRACRDCVVTVMLAAPTVRRAGADPGADTGTGIELDRQEQAAIAALAGSGLVPPLRLVARPVDPDEAGVLNWDHEPAPAAPRTQSGTAHRTGHRTGDAASRRHHREAG